MRDDANRREAALDWLVRTNDSDFANWDEFTTWLETDPANANAYHSVVAGEQRLRPLIEAAPTTGATHSHKSSRRWAIAASVMILATAVTAILGPQMRPEDYSTAPGEVRTVSLGGKDKLVMNGDTHLELAGFDRRTVRLERGQILLQLREPEQDKIEVLAGELQLIDVGTVFEVSREGNQTRVLVGQGTVMADPGGARLKLAAGQRLDTRDGDAILRIEPADMLSVGSFEQGQLTYLDEPFDNVCTDLHRSTGVDFSVTPGIATRRFSGTLSVAEVRRDPRSLEPLLGVSMERSGRGWKLGGKV
jgi:transmembrane sensor